MWNYLSIFLLSAAVSASPIEKASPEVCMALHCAWEIGVCVLNPGCMDALTCMQDCAGQEDESQCQFNCEMSLGQGNEAFENLLRCMAENGCFPEVAPDGICLATPEDTVQEITSLEMVAGDWWVVRGINCGQDEVWRGAYDWYPCQHGRFTIVDGNWVNNTTYCGGKDNECTTDTIVTIPQMSLPSPGLVRLDYDDAPLLPQVEKWHFVSMPDPEFALVLWCGENPALSYNGGYVVSRTRTEEGMSAETEAAFRAAADKFGFDYDAMCLSNNTHCEE